MAGGTIDLNEIAMPEIPDPRQVKGLHSSLCSWNVLRALRGFVNADHDRMQPRKHFRGARTSFGIHPKTLVGLFEAG